MPELQPDRRVLAVQYLENCTAGGQPPTLEWIDEITALLGIADGVETEVAETPERLNRGRP